MTRHHASEAIHDELVVVDYRHAQRITMAAGGGVGFHRMVRLGDANQRAGRSTSTLPTPADSRGATAPRISEPTPAERTVPPWWTPSRQQAHDRKGRRTVRL